MNKNGLLSRIDGLSQIASDYRGILCDVWGVIHNGVTARQEACNALAEFRQAGGRVVLVTNAPRPNAPIFAQLDRLGVARAAYDDVVTSGDVARRWLAEADVGAAIHIGPERDLPLFDNLPIQLVERADEARMVVCTGLVDDEAEEPEDYRDRFGDTIRAGLPLICANPDIVVERGGKLVWCAGSLERLYKEMGGTSQIVGKPHRPIYDTSLDRLNQLAGRRLDRSEILAIGDGLPTDIRGALNEGIDALFITSGIHAADYGETQEPDLDRAMDSLREHGLAARALLPELAW